MTWQNGQRKIFWSEPGCGPTAIAPYRQSDLIVLCHLGAKIVRLDKDGKKLADFFVADSGERLQDPNDCHGDGRGGVFFSDAGVFMKGAPATGKVFHISETGRIVKIIDNLQYANGVAYDARGRRLLVSEHLARKVWQYKLGSDSSVIDSSVFLDIDKHFSPAEMDFRETGPDGIEIDHEGNTYIPVYGAGHVMVVMAGGETKKLPVAMKFVTNIAVSGARLAVVGAFANDRAPYPGRVEVLPRQEFLEKGAGNASAPRR
jgi:sugar lactone lactonase YvrE